MSSVRADLESIAADSKWCPLFEQQLKKSYNHQNLAFWIALHELKQTADAGGDVATPLDAILSTFVDTESSASVALSFRAKERLKRARSQPPDELRKALDVAQREVEVLMATEVQAFLANAPPPGGPKSVVAKSAVPLATTRSDRAQSEAVWSSAVSTERAKTASATTRGASLAAPTSSAVAAPAPSTATAMASPTTKTRGDARSYSVASTAPPRAARSAAAAGERLGSGAGGGGGGGGSSGVPSLRPLAASAVAAVASVLPTTTTPNKSPMNTARIPARTYPWDVTPFDAPSLRPHSDRMVVYAWGDNAATQLGELPGGLQASDVPLLLSTRAAQAVTVQCSDAYSVVVDASGQAFCVGAQLECSSWMAILEGHVVRQVGCGMQFCIALLDNGRLLYYGLANRAIEKLPLPETVTKVACGTRHCVALTNQGHVYTWGSNERKQLGHVSVERVPKPRLLPVVDDAVDVAAGRNSSACVTASGAVSVWGAITESVQPSGEPVIVDDFRNKSVFRVACSDFYVVGVSDLGRMFVWRPDEVASLSLPAGSPNPAVCLRSSSVFAVACQDRYLVALTDTGDVITWGEYCVALGQGPRESRRYAEQPYRLPELQHLTARRVCAAEQHVLIATGNGQSRREQLLWELFVHERRYGRVLYAIVDEYSRRIKIKDTPDLFRNAKLLQDHHMALLREFIKALESTPTAPQMEVGLLYSLCFANGDLLDTYRAWDAETALPLEKLSRPKLAAQLAEVELDVEAVTKKLDCREDIDQSFALVSLLREPSRYLRKTHDLMQELLRETPADHTDHALVQKALVALVSASGGALANSSATERAVTAPSSTAASPSLAAAGGGGDDDALVQEKLRVRALQTELDIFRDANVQLVRYALALEQELIASKPMAGAGGGGGGGGGGSLLPESLAAFEEEMVATARENAELRTRLKMLDFYRAQVEASGGAGASEDLSAEPTTPVQDRGSSAEGPQSAISSPNGSGTLPKYPARPPSSLSQKMVRAKSQNAVSPLLTRASGSSPASRSPSTTQPGHGRKGSESGSSTSNSSPRTAVVAGEKECEDLRKRINPAAGRLLSEGEGSAARSLEQFTFDDTSSAGVVYSGTELKAATLEKLLEHLTQSSGSLALDTFLISYRNFASPQDVLRRLVYMYCIAPRAKSKVVWVRVLNFVKSWCIKFFEEDWEQNEPLRRELLSFLDEVVVPSFPNSASLAVNAIRERLSGGTAERHDSQRALVPPRPAGPLASGNYKPAVIAEQLIISEHANFRAIKPGECFNQNWVKKGSNLSPNIVNVTQRFNKLSRWVAFEIVQHSDVRERRAALERWINVAALCREQYRAFGIVMVIVGGLTSTAVFRLKKTWEALARQQQSTFNDLKEFTKSENNFSTLREATRIAELPCYPYIGTYLGDLTFIDAGAADYTAAGLINWSKFQATANTLLQLQAKQKTAYPFEPMAEWHQFLYHLPDYSEQELYDMSKRHEPSTNTTK